MATRNLAIGPENFDPYCITAPLDSRLPGGGGNQLCGLYDIRGSAFGAVNNLVTQASHYGKQTEVYNGIDVGINVRFGEGGLFSGGVSTGRTVTDNCFTVDSPQQRRPGFCHVVLPWSGQTQVKFAGSYPLPWNFQVSAVLQNLPGIPIAASFVATNAQILRSLGRNLGQCGASATCNGTVAIDLIQPNTKFEDRLNQFDLRLTKTLRVGPSRRLRGMFDLYNLFNASTILSENTRYGLSWLRPTAILSGRLIKFGGQFDF
jgi:hypothetical protein